MTDVIALQPHLWVVSLIALGIALIGVLLRFGFENWFGYNHGNWSFAAMFFFVIAGIMAVVSVLAFIPFDSKYHVLYKLEGKVESVSNTFDNGSGKMTAKPVVKLSGYDEPIQMDNPRIVTLEGREVVLTCRYSWEMYGLDITKCDLAAIK